MSDDKHPIQHQNDGWMGNSRPNTSEGLTAQQSWDRGNQDMREYYNPPHAIPNEVRSTGGPAHTGLLLLAFGAMAYIGYCGWDRWQYIKEHFKPITPVQIRQNYQPPDNQGSYQAPYYSSLPPSKPYVDPVQPGAVLFLCNGPEYYWEKPLSEDPLRGAGPDPDFRSRQLLTGTRVFVKEVQGSEAAVSLYSPTDEANDFKPKDPRKTKMWVPKDMFKPTCRPY